MKKILIVSMKAGYGHLKAAQAIESALKKEKKFEIKNIDLLDYSNILSKKFYGKWYLDIANKVPEFYSWLYDHLDSFSTKFRLFSDRINAQKFKKFVDSYQPDLIICTQFVPANLLTYWRKKYKHHYKIILNLTDYDAHKLWVDNEVDAYTVATNFVKSRLEKFGANPQKIHITGMPVDLKFTQNFSTTIIRKKLGLDDKFTIALFAGALGIGPIEKTLSSINKIDKDFQVIVVAGKNKKLFRKIKKISLDSNRIIKTFGYINNMEEIMAISDIAISKAGGLTIAECLTMGLPLIISHPLPGQEEDNANYLIKHRAALMTNNANELKKIINTIIDNPIVLNELKNNIKKITKKDAALNIARLISKLV